MQKNDRIVQLLYRRLKGLPLNLDENQELDAWLAHSESNRRIYESLSNEEWLQEAKAKYFAPGKEAGLIQLREQLFTTKKRPVRWAQLSIAASIFILFATGIYYYLIPTKQSTQTLVALADLKNQLEILPGGEAILTLSNGSQIPFSKHANGVLAQLGDGKQLIKQDGKLVYQSAVAQYTAGGVDTTNDPRSDQYSVMLPDGSRVWLNRGSTLLYPETFAADSRTVELDGEAYFEIAKLTDRNQQRIPFIVKTARRETGGEPEEVQVLGTHFNVFAHKDDPVATTLMEGKVRVKKGQMVQLLDPGQQAITNSDENIEVKTNVYTEDVLAWKKNRFNFQGESISRVMREIYRWYGNSYVIVGEINKSITITTDRNKPLSELLNILEENGYAHFKMNGATIQVTP